MRLKSAKETVEATPEYYWFQDIRVEPDVSDILVI